MQNSFAGNNSLVQFEIGNKRSIKLQELMNKYFEISYKRHGYWSFHLFPYCFISSTNGQTFSIQSFFPLNDNQTSFTSCLYASLSYRDDIVNKYLDSIKELNRKIFLEDHDMC